MVKEVLKGEAMLNIKNKLVVSSLTLFLTINLSGIFYGGHQTSAQSTDSVITPLNAHNMQELKLFGQVWINDINWSSNDKTLAVATSVGTWVYQADHLEE